MAARNRTQPTPKKALRLEYRSPTELRENPRNWRKHPKHQLDALADVIGEVGWAGAVLFNERTGRIIDGHARLKIASQKKEAQIPVIVGDWSEAEEVKILATLDPLSSLAEADIPALEALLQDVETGSESVQGLLDQLAKEHGIERSEPERGEASGDEPEGDPPGEIPESYKVLVVCANEQEQGSLLERLTGEGYQCHSLIS